MADLYLPGAERRQLDDAPTAGDGGCRTIWHITWDRNATADAPADLLPFDTLAGYFAGDGAGVAPHLLWDPFTGRAVQYFAATSRSKSVVNAPGGVETNRKGNVCIQIESLFFPYCRVDGRVYPTLADAPCTGLAGIVDWLRSWGSRTSGRWARPPGRPTVRPRPGTPAAATTATRRCPRTTTPIPGPCPTCSAFRRRAGRPTAAGSTKK
ncbi:hypothetical protein GCM10025734_77670 [Kitasatospora paranensis]|uniref:hypothetical protein n=1 Tax=Kitasatospora paranensis TaxID=258053 RepID=UPI0031E8C742